MKGREKKSRRARKGAYVSGVGRTGAGNEKLISGEGGVKEQEAAGKGTRRGEKHRNGGESDEAGYETQISTEVEERKKAIRGKGVIEEGEKERNRSE